MISSAAGLPFGSPLENKASVWFQKEYSSYFGASGNDTAAPVIYGVSVSPKSLKIGDPRSEINAFVYDDCGIEMVYADVGNRMNLMLDLDLDHRFTGYCGSNLPPGTYNVTIVAIDRAGNAAKDETGTIIIRDPRDLNGNGIEDSLERQGEKDLRVIVLHDENLTDGERGERLRVLPGTAMTVPRERLEEIASKKGVRGVYKDQRLKVLSSPGLASRQEVRSVDDPRAGHGLTGEGVTVALIDTGADPGHRSLEGRIAAFRDFVNNQTAAYDDNGHGTHCASLIAGRDGVGVAPGADLVIVKVMDREGACYLSDALKALDWCLENRDRYGIKVISFSVGGESPSDGTSLLDEACNRMVDEGLTMCVAAGNSGPAPGTIVVPGDAENVITVGAIDGSGSIFELSSRGPTASGEIKPDLVTMGVDVVSALAGTGDGYSSMSGTSMAVPQVAGASALLLEARPDLGPADIKRILLKTADDLGQSGPDNVYGSGAMNLSEALRSMTADPERISSPSLEGVELNRQDASVGEPVMIEARAFGEIRAITTRIFGPDRSLEIPMEDFDANGIYSARWETSFWTPGEYRIQVDMQGRFGEADSETVPFHLSERG